MAAKKKRKPPTKTSHAMVMAVLRRYVWLRSPERRAALKSTDNHCADCCDKFTRAKGREVLPNVHHLDAIEDVVIDGVSVYQAVEVVRQAMTCDPSRLVPLCKGCHLVRHAP
jgi:hypothetical protein